MDGSLIAHCLGPEGIGQARLDESRACHLKDGTIRTLSYAVGLGGVRCRVVCVYTTAGGKLGNRSLLSAVVGVNGLYLRLLTTLEFAQK
jgi:hypothetical protein